LLHQERQQQQLERALAQQAQHHQAVMRQQQLQHAQAFQALAEEQRRQQQIQPRSPFYNPLPVLATTANQTPLAQGNGLGLSGTRGLPEQKPIAVRFPVEGKLAAACYNDIVGQWGSLEKFARKEQLAGIEGTNRQTIVTMARAMDVLVRNDGISIETTGMEIMMRRLMAMHTAARAGSWEPASRLEEEGCTATKSRRLIPSGIIDALDAEARRERKLLGKEAALRDVLQQLGAPHQQ
jgi:hypothetical protein